MYARSWIILSLSYVLGAFRDYSLGPCPAFFCPLIVDELAYPVRYCFPSESVSFFDVDRAPRWLRRTIKFASRNNSTDGYLFITGNVRFFVRESSLMRRKSNRADIASRVNFHTRVTNISQRERLFIYLGNKQKIDGLFLFDTQDVQEVYSKVVAPNLWCDKLRRRYVSVYITYLKWNCMRVKRTSAWLRADRNSMFFFLFLYFSYFFIFFFPFLKRKIKFCMKNGLTRLIVKLVTIVYALLTLHGKLPIKLYISLIISTFATACEL